MTDENMELNGEPGQGSLEDDPRLSGEHEEQMSAEAPETTVQPESEEGIAAPMAGTGSPELPSLSAEEPAAQDMAVVQKSEPEVMQTETARPIPPEPESGEAGSQVDYSRTFRSLSQGDVVDGIVVHIDKEGVLVDVGTKSEGIIRPEELSVSPVQSAEDVVAVGDKIDVYVLQPENEDGNPILSKKRADFETAWERVQQAYEEGKRLTAMVTDRVKGGLVVDLGIRGFVPGSHVGTGKVKSLDRYVGQSLPFKVIEVDRERRKVVLSHRLAIEEERAKQREKTIASLTEGQIREGIVRRITDYGAFIDLGGIDGLLHISEMSWTRINYPSEVVRVGQKLHVMILKLNLEAGRVSLGLRQILPDPWADIGERYKVGQIVTGAVSRLVPFGAFVQLDGGIEGIIPNTELSHRRIKKPEDVVSVGEMVEAKITDIRLEERRMSLSVRQIREDKESKDYESYKSSRSDTGMTLGDLVGDKLQELVSSIGPVEDEKETQEAAEPVSEPQSEESAAAPEAVAVEIEEPVVEQEIKASVADMEEDATGKATGDSVAADAPSAPAKRRSRAKSKKPSEAATEETATS